LPSAYTDIYHQDILGFTPLHLAYIQRQAEKAKTLFADSRVNCATVDEVGRTPLYYAVHLDNYDISVLLVERYNQTSE